jgi:hypothetical protein
MGRGFLRTLNGREAGIGAALVGLLAFSVYLRTLAPTVMWYDMGEFATVSYVLGIAHNTGYPLYTLLGKLFTLIPVGDVAYRVNLMSAVFAALTVATVYLIVYRLTGSWLASALGSLTLAFSSTLWASANWAESYPLNAFSTALITLLLLHWRESGRAWQLYLVFLVFGLSLGNHRLILLLLPGMLIFLWAGRGGLSSGRLLRCALLFLLGLSVYVYLPLRGSQHPDLNWAQPATWRTYLSMFLTGSSPRDYWDFAFLGRLNVLSVFPWYELTPFGLALAALGLIETWRRQRLFAVYGLSLCALVGLVALTYSIHNIYNYFIPAYLILGVWIGCGARALLAFVFQRAAVGRLQLAHSGYYLFLPLAALLLLLPSYLLARNLPRVDRSDDHSAYDFALTTLARVKPHSTIITDSWAASPLWYLQLVEGYRRDVFVSPVFSAPGEDVNAFIAEQFEKGRPVYVAEGLRTDLEAIGSEYYLQPVVLDSIETMATDILPRPEYKDDLVSRGSFYRVLQEEPSLTVDEVPEDARLSLPFGESLTLIGFQAEPAPGQRGDVIRLDYYWRLSEKTDRDLEATVLFTDESDRVDSRHGFPLWWQGWELGGRIHPTSEWEQGEIVKEEYYVLAPRGVDAGSYRVRMRVSEGPPVDPAGPSDVSGDVQIIGTVTLQ